MLSKLFKFVTDYAKCSFDWKYLSVLSFISVMLTTCNHSFACEEREESFKSPRHCTQMSLVPEGLLESVIKHRKRHRRLLSEEGIQKVAIFAEKLDYFVGLQIVLRADNQHLHEPLKKLPGDYRMLIEIANGKTQISVREEHLFGIISCHNKTELSANRSIFSQYQCQHDSIDIMICEYIESYQNNFGNFQKITEKNSVLVRENAEMLCLYHAFIQSWKVLLKAIEDEREDFLHILHKFSGHTKRDMKFEQCVEGFPSLIDRFEEVAGELKMHEAEMKQKEIEMQAAERNSSESDNSQTKKKGMSWKNIF